MELTQGVEQVEVTSWSTMGTRDEADTVSLLQDNEGTKGEGVGQATLSSAKATAKGEAEQRKEMDVISGVEEPLGWAACKGVCKVNGYNAHRFEVIATNNGVKEDAAMDNKPQQEVAILNKAEEKDSEGHILTTGLSNMVFPLSS